MLRVGVVADAWKHERLNLGLPIHDWSPIWMAGLGRYQTPIDLDSGAASMNHDMSGSVTKFAPPGQSDKAAPAQSGLP
jgi:hypothetical protein